MKDLTDAISDAVASGPDSVADLAAEIHGGRAYPGDEAATRWASGWACWAVHAHDEGRGPWPKAA